MEFTTILFYIFASILVVSALRIITASDPVQSALFLVLAFFNAAALWLLLHAEFLAILLVLVYVGAVMVLFLFVVMMLDLDLGKLRRDFKRFVPTSMIIGGLMITEIALILWRGYGGATAPANHLQVQANGETVSNTHALGKLIYTDYIFAFEIAGLLLLVAMIAAVALTLHHGKDRKRTDSAKQIRVRREDRVRIVKMRSEASVESAANPVGSTDPARGKSTS
ncbi:MAG: NADH-quinone oxidoreductase subunit J [Glomeribacter sp. 1016415]|uniref:NADH-quinone oxidoreductase subunit J n=1 Tax=Mycoavidus cysteinexigens TaxID=1553431 RepID=A0A2Z6EWP2_9BURK|nr:NADH-quinone oxidoreductase subunit J [Mycoavidus cysteinexigens]MCX8566664.1 NADH-quinone oxidoreductase subunit J [Glomeribacter sp. 1016415]BBE09870.1 NADH dehydrogenase subunit J [Mycoavidus cysteinexigens]GAM53781.1 NADH-ubiquinone oxidoreductase chain J [bacterium endosymbiont of Mortierella elongata FMR23-6]GLR02318.1 NADH dehydrogenase subunit J [Mycoavidus cysteinexigens]